MLCTAKPGFDLAQYDIEPAISFSDRFSDWPPVAFAFGCEVDDETRSEIDALLEEDDGTPNLDCAPEDAPEYDYTLNDTLPFAKVTMGFRKAMAKLLVRITSTPFTIDKPSIVLKLKNGSYRLFLFNDSDTYYQRAFVTSKNYIKSVDIVSKFPVLPPRFIDKASGKLTHLYVGEQDVKKSFEVKLQPGGVTIVDVY